MAKISKLSIILPEKKASATDVVTYARRVKTNLTTYAETFPNPTVKLPDFEAAITTLENSIVTGKEKSDATDERTAQFQKPVMEMLYTLSVYVLMVANSDRYIAGLSGFTLNKEESEAKKTEDLAVDNSKPGKEDGTVIISLKGRAGYDLFIVERKTETGWTMLWAYRKLYFTVKGLPSGSSILRITGTKGDVPGDSIEIVVKAF